MNLNRTKKLFSMVCVCSMLTIGSAQVAFAGPSTGYESDMVATVAADLSIYADEDENSEVVAMAEKGESYDVVGKADDSWIKVAAGEMHRSQERLRYSLQSGTHVQTCSCVYEA